MKNGVVGVRWGPGIELFSRGTQYAHGLHLVVLYFLAQLWPNQLVFNPQIQVK